MIALKRQENNKDDRKQNGKKIISVIILIANGLSDPTDRQNFQSVFFKAVYKRHTLNKRTRRDGKTNLEKMCTLQKLNRRKLADQVDFKTKLDMKRDVS